MAFAGPGVPWKGTPKSRARGFDSGGIAQTALKEAIAVIEKLLAEHPNDNRALEWRLELGTDLLYRLAEIYKVPVYETPVGFKYVAPKMLETDAIIGGEESGGLSIKGHIPEKDGILADLLVIEAVSKFGKPMSQLNG
jgi:phosphoglucomutase